MKQEKLHTTAVAYRRQKQIEDCLYENLLHSSYQSISVADLCRQVGISRKAFYNHYHDKDACLCAMIDRILQEAMLHISRQTPDDAAPLETAVAILDYWKSQKGLLDIIIRDNLFPLLVFRNIHYVLREDRSLLNLLDTPEVQSDTDILACYIASQLTLVLQWYIRGFDTPTEEMARKLLRIMHAPMILPPV